MNNTINCPSCQGAISVAASMAGQQGKCPGCGAIIQVAAQVSDAAVSVTAKNSVTSQGSAATQNSAAANQTTAQSGQPFPHDPADARFQQYVLQSFRGEVEEVEWSSSYRFGMILMTLVSATLPLVYFSILAFVISAMIYHVVHYDEFFSTRNNAGSMLISGGLYVFGTVVGVTTVLFMIKPLFGGFYGSEKSRFISRDREPLFFAFVDRICEKVDAPKPKRIEVSCDVNAGARLGGGFMGIFDTENLELIIGMPLVSGMTMQQLAGVMAHEFGHFHRQSGMRVRNVHRYFSHWFARIIYERDGFDYWLERLQHTGAGCLSIPLVLAALMVKLNRWFLMGLRKIGQAVDGYATRQEEFDADRYEARVAGSKHFEDTCWRLGVLNLAHAMAKNDVYDFYRDGKLADNIPGLIVNNLRHMKKKHLNAVVEMINETKTGWLDDHPADRDRIVSAREENCSGIFALDLPAELLFCNYNTLCKEVTFDLYKELLGSDFKRSDTRPLTTLVDEQDREIGESQSLMRYSQMVFSPLRPVRFPSWYIEATNNAPGTAAKMKEAREIMWGQAPSRQETLKNYRKQDRAFAAAVAAETLFAAGFKPSKEDFKISVGSSSSVRRAKNDASNTVAQLGGQLEAFESALGNRLYSALQLLHAPEVAARIPNSASLQRECNKILPALAVLSTNIPLLIHIRNGSSRLGILGPLLEDHHNDEYFIDEVRRAMSHGLDNIRKIHSGLNQIEHPLDHAAGRITLARYVITELPTHDDLGGIYDTCEEVLDKYPSLYMRLAGRLAAIGEAVEAVYGLQKFPDPPKSDDDEDDD